ncbi:hypothetical protein OESDEN_22102 [Oesophagostomum dentatum]|uniref:Uncharacterized protein n=1 Tax=Oesophagostomum dentatum TaxID=61180 RepID=A0A0B1RYW2_OESDE|nr:hypothetical protein OESDEN_22102 [Oesophagostomum dentatum]
MSITWRYASKLPELFRRLFKYLAELARILTNTRRNVWELLVLHLKKQDYLI